MKAKAILSHVCFLISSFPPIIGGAERATENLAIGLKRVGMDIAVVTRRQRKGLIPYEEKHGISIYREGFPLKNKLGAVTFALQSLFRLATHLRKYEIVHVQSPDTPLIIGLICRLLMRRKLVVTIHGENRIRSMSKSASGRLRLSAMARFGDFFTAITPEVRRQLMSLGVPASRIDLIPNGVDLDRFYPPSAECKSRTRDWLNLLPSDRVVLFVGRLVPVKRVDLLLQAWAAINKTESDQLLIVGDGPELGALKQQANSLAIKVRFVGSSNDVVSYLQAADIFVLPSGLREQTLYEGLPVALLEAMATGLAVIATDAGGNRFVMHPNVNGLLFPVEDVQALATQLNTLLENYPLRSRLGKKAGEYIRQTYSIENASQKTLALYKNLLQFDVMR